MFNRFALRTSLLAIAVTLAALLTTGAAVAQNKAVEAQARALAKKAMEEDYLSTEFDKAIEKLNQAVAKCGTDKCSAALRGQLKRDLGVIQAAGQNKKAEAVTTFVEAMKIDPNVQLDPDLKTKEVEVAWEEAKRQLGGKGTPPASSSGEPSGDFTHTPAAEQLVRTPVPVYAEYGGSEQLARVVVKYKGFGMTEWKTLELKALGKGYGAEIPCMDVQQGDMQYYLQGFNAANDPVATGGDRNKPYKVPVKRDKIDGEPPHLPGREASKQCADSGDCPPDFPGCKKGGGAAVEAALKAEGDDCESDAECKSNTCLASKTCAGGEEGGEAKPAKRAKFWVGIAGAIDFVFLPSSDNVCRLQSSKDGDPDPGLPKNTAGYYCTDTDGNDYPVRKESENDKIVKDKSDKVSGGVAPGTIRVMLSLDYALTNNFLIGARFGYVINTYPGTAASDDGKTFAPLHGELRATYVIGKNALASKGMQGFVFAGGGVSQWNAAVDVTVIETGSNGGKSVKAWNIAGPGFITVGGGLRYAFSPRFAMMIGPRFNVAFGSNGTLPSLAPEVGIAYGF